MGPIITGFLKATSSLLALDCSGHQQNIQKVISMYLCCSPNYTIVVTTIEVNNAYPNGFPIIQFLLGQIFLMLTKV